MALPSAIRPDSFAIKRLAKHRNKGDRIGKRYSANLIRADRAWTSKCPHSCLGLGPVIPLFLAKLPAKAEAYSAKPSAAPTPDAHPDAR